MTNVVVCIPIFNDWQPAVTLLAQLDTVAATMQSAVDVLLVDDGSTETRPETQDHFQALRRVTVLRLRRNVGHQRAIALALTHLYASANHDLIVVMDGDGEDAPLHVPLLVEQCLQSNSRRAIFAKRAKRSEGWLFRLGYAGFKVVHRLLVGRKVEVGNFSVLPRAIVERLVAMSEMWNHYAAAVFHGRLPVELVPVPRARRLAGKSKMNVLSLVTHGLSAISVYSDVVGARILAILAMAGVTTMVGIAGVIVVKAFTRLAIPGWATNTVGLLVVSLLNLALMSMFMVLFTLRARTEYSFLPLRDYRYFILDEKDW
jgi:glycosyltransferase involved in cell wall biosynthesis